MEEGPEGFLETVNRFPYPRAFRLFWGHLKSSATASSYVENRGESESSQPHHLPTYHSPCLPITALILGFPQEHNSGPPVTTRSSGSTCFTWTYLPEWILTSTGDEDRIQLEFMDLYEGPGRTGVFRLSGNNGIDHPRRFGTGRGLRRRSHLRFWTRLSCCSGDHEECQGKDQEESQVGKVPPTHRWYRSQPRV